MRTSDTIAKLAPALVAAQLDLSPIGKDRENSHYRNKYATLDAIVGAVRPALAKHGLAVVQGVSSPIEAQAGTLHAVAVVTRLVHTSGEWIESRVIVPLAKLDPQGAGSAVTYGRRYALSALLSLATEDDDDAESAIAPRQSAPAAPPAASHSSRSHAPAKASGGPGGGKVMPFGKTKGKLLSELPERELQSTLDWCAEKGKFEDLQADIRAELESRGVGDSFPAYDKPWTYEGEMPF